MVKANHALSNSAQSATDLIPVRLLPSPHPGQCCSVLVSNDPTELQHCFFITGRGGGGGGGGSISSCQCFQKLHLETSHGNVNFLSKIVAICRYAHFITLVSCLFY